LAEERIYKKPLRWKRWLLVVGIAIVAAAVVIPVVLVTVAWSRIDRVEFDPGAARDQLAQIETATSLDDVDAIENLVDLETVIADHPGLSEGTDAFENYTPEFPTGAPATAPTTTTTTVPYPPPPTPNLLRSPIRPMRRSS